MKYPEEIKEQLLHAEDVMSHSENYLERSDVDGNFPNKFEAMRDLIADLMHYAEANKVYFHAVLQDARYQYECENGRIYAGGDAILDVHDERLRRRHG